MKNKAAQSLAKLRWARIPKEERAQPPHNPTGIGGRPRIYPQCPRYKVHYQSFLVEDVMTNEYPIPSPEGQPIIIHAIQHIRRMHMNCRTWTLPQGDEKAVNLLLNVYHGYLTGYELPANEFDRINYPDDELPTCPDCGGAGHSRCEPQYPEPEFDRINHGPFAHPVE